MLPYDRTLLSKMFGADPSGLLIAPSEFYALHNIELSPETEVRISYSISHRHPILILTQPQGDFNRPANTHDYHS
jgi:hypothetical protein